MGSGISFITSFLTCRVTVWVNTISRQDCCRSVASMKGTFWTARTSDGGPVQKHLGVRLGRLALGCRHRCSSSHASLSIPQSFQSLPLFKSASGTTFLTWKSLLQRLSGITCLHCDFICFVLMVRWLLVFASCSLSKG